MKEVIVRCACMCTFPHKALLRWLAALPLPLVSIHSVTSGAIIHHVTGLSYPGWLISILFAATSHSPHTPISICIGNREKLVCPRRHLISARQVVCAGVCAEMKNLSTYRVSIWKQYLLLPLLIVCDVLEQRVAALGSPPHLRFGSRTQLRCINFTPIRQHRHIKTPFARLLNATPPPPSNYFNV